MKSLDISELKETQNEYSKLIKGYSESFSTIDFDSSLVSSFIEEVEIFWLKRLDSLRIMLEILTQENQCYILSGAIYLGCKDNEHFPFKALGDYQIMPDPFLKMDPFFRSNFSNIGSQNKNEFFIKVYKDTYKVLTEYESHFIILPVSHLAWGYAKEKHFQLLKEVHLNFLSAILKNEITSDEKFSELYKNFSDIENDLNEFYSQNLIFSGMEDARLPIGERVNIYIKDNLPPLLDKSDSVKFIFATFNMIGQITDILLTSSILKLVPFIRYFLMMNSILKEDKETEMMLNKSILSHLFYESYPAYFFSKIEYNEYIKELNNYNLIEEVYEKLDLKNKNIQDYKLIEVVDVIKSKFNNNVLKNLSMT